MNIFKDILCVVDVREDCVAALERAVSLAESNQASLTVLDVVDRITAGIGMPDGSPISADLQSAMVASDRQALEELVDPYRKRVSIKIEVRKGIRFMEIIRQVLDNGYDLVIKVPEKLDWFDRLFGSDDMNLLRECPCPVWLVKPQIKKSYRLILAAVDTDDGYPSAELKSRDALNREVLEIACSLALSDFAELHVVHAWQAIGENAMRGAFMHTPEIKIINYVEQVRRQRETKLNRAVHEVTSQLGEGVAEYLNPQIHLIKGGPREEIPKLAKQLEADVIVMGTVARAGVPGFIMGNTAETILNQINCSVLAIKPSEFETPVTLEE